MDMVILRKCPCPVWLCRPISHSRDKMKIAVAIDPDAQQDADNALSKTLLEYGATIAASCNNQLDVVSCWNHSFEKSLRNHPWLNIPDEEIDEEVQQYQQTHRQKLDEVINSVKIAPKVSVHHVQGKPDIAIPDFTEEKEIDILVMGTVARTGIPGFIIGNTAENIAQQLQCSLLALKPKGFVSPVKV